MRVKPQQVCPCPESRARSFLLLRLPAPFSAREEILSLCLIPQSLPPNPSLPPPKPLLSFDSPHLSPRLPLAAALRAFPAAHFVPFFLHYSPPCSLQANLSWLFPPLLCGAPPQEAGEQPLQRGRGGRVQAGGDNGARHGGKLGCFCPRASPASGDCVRWTQPQQAWEGRSDLSCGGFFVFFSFHLKVTGLGHVACGSKAPCSTSSQ